MKTPKSNDIYLHYSRLPVALARVHQRQESRRILAEMVCDIFGIEDIRIAQTSNGKPYIMGEDIHFNYSHSKGFLCVAISNYPIGVDIEYIKRKVSVMPIAKRFFHSSEYQDLLESRQKSRDFFLLWTQKEALIKARGGRIVTDIQKSIFELSYIDPTHAFKCVTLSPTDDFLGHVATPIKAPQISIV